MAELQAAGDKVYSELKNLVVWAKTNGGMGTFYRSRHELIYVWKVGTAPHTNTFGLGEHGRYRTNVWEYPGVNSFGGNQKDLALHSGRDKGQIARLIAGLRERGLLDAEVDAADRRNIRLELSADGRAAHKALHAQARRVAEAAVAGLDAGQRRELVALLGTVCARLTLAD